jgi:histidinol-phosphatase (PHP family)
MRDEYGPFIKSLASDPRVDYFIGSIHHLDNHPIDLDKDFYNKAIQAAGETEEALYEAYYDRQHDMLAVLRPRVVGHIDVIRLLSEEPGRDLKNWKGVWNRVIRNLEFIKGYGGWLECNSSALRKGLVDPYPCRVIAEVSSS